MTDNRQTTRTFQCREALWACFEQMARELECSVDYLLNDAMKQYARQRGYNSMGADSHSPSPTSSMPPSLRPSTPMMRAPLPPAPQAAPLPPVPPPGRPAPYYPPPAARAGGMPGGALPPPSQPAVRRPPPAPLPPPPAARQMPAQAGYYVPSSVPPSYGNQGAPMGGPGMGGAPMGGPGMGGPGMGGPGMGMGGPGMGGGMAPGMGAPMNGPGMNGPGMNGPGMGGAPMGGPGMGPGMGVAPGGGRPTVNIYYMGERYPVTKDRFIIGRGRQSSDLTIKDPNVSRQHAMIEYLNGYYYIVDMGSTNGVEYAGQRIQRRVVGEGDTFRVCDHELRFSYH